MKAKGTVSISLKMKVHPRQANKWGTWNTCDLSNQHETMTKPVKMKIDILENRMAKGMYIY